MNNALERSSIVVKKSPIHGYGVFADQLFQEGDVIEECYVLLTEKNTLPFSDYYFWNGEYNLLALGDGSIFNHSDHPNAVYTYDVDRQVMVFKAKESIQPDSEILISYGQTWFSSREIKPKELSLRRKLMRPVLLAARFGLVIVLMISLIGLMNRFNHSAGMTFKQISDKQ